MNGAASFLPATETLNYGTTRVFFLLVGKNKRVISPNHWCQTLDHVCFYFVNEFHFRHKSIQKSRDDFLRTGYTSVSEMGSLNYCHFQLVFLFLGFG